MKVGDIVRVTHASYPDVAVEGEVLDIEEVETGPYTTTKHVTIRDFLNYKCAYSIEHFDIFVIRSAPVPEPTGLGDLYIDSDGDQWIRYTERDDISVRWIRTKDGLADTWKGVSRGF